MHQTKSKISGMIPKGFKADKCKVSLRMAMSRMKLLRNKREVQVRQMRRDVAQLLQSGQDQTARIRVEHVIREEKTMTAYELLELYCELIVARLPSIDSQKNCPIDLQEAISSVIFASPRCADVQELMDVRKQFLTKYGKEFNNAALELRPDCGVSHMIVEKLSAKAPDMETKIKTLKSIAEEHGIEWDSKALLDELQKSKNDLLAGPPQFPSASQVAMDHSASSSLHTSTQPKPTQFLSASQVAMGYMATDSSATSVQTSSQAKPTQFASASEVTMGYSDTGSNTNASTGQISSAQPKDVGATESIVAKPPDDQIPQHGGIISSTGTVIYPPPPPPFMRSEESAPSNTQSEFSCPEDASREEKTKPKYKDAKAAARAAAESADRAQMAARAAAELARRENKARRRTQVEEDTYTVPDVASVENETENLPVHNDKVVPDSQSNEEEEEEEEITSHATGTERENEYDLIWDKHEPSVAVFDRSNSNIYDHSTNLLDTFSQLDKEEYAPSNFYWREKADSIKQSRGESVFFEDSTKDSSPPQFVNSSAPTFDSDGLSSDNEDKSDVKAQRSQSKYSYSEEREKKEGAAFDSGMKSTTVSYDDDDDDEPVHDLNFGKLTGGLKNKGYRQPPYIKKPIIDATPSVETLDDHDVYVSSRTQKPPPSDIGEAEASYVLSEETDKGSRGSKKPASRFDRNYFNTEGIARVANEDVIKPSRRTQDAAISNVRKDDNIQFRENQHVESSDEENTNESVLAEKSELQGNQMKSSASSSSTSVRSRRPPDYDTLAAHFRSLRANRP